MSKKKKINLIEAAMKYRQVTLAFATILLGLGIYAVKTMPRAENPTIEMPIAMIVSFYPGADVYQTEQQITKKIEKYLFTFEEIDKKKTTSETKAGQTFITVRLRTEVKDRKRFWATLQHGMNTEVMPTLPKGSIGPIVNSSFGDVTALILSLSSPTRDYSELEGYLDQVEDELKTIPTVAKINRSGLQQAQISVEINNQKLLDYGITSSHIVSVLQAQNLTMYSGEVNMPNTTIPIFANSELTNQQDLENLIVYTNPSGEVVRLNEVAKIQRTYTDKTSFIRMGEDKVLMLAIEMQSGNNLVEFGNLIQKKLAEIGKTLPQDVKIDTIVSQPDAVDLSVSHFMKEFVMAIGACVLVVVLLLPFRVAAVASVAAPISFIITFGVMNLFGIELHQVSLAALVIVLGMVIDNAIVIVDNYVEKLDEGIKPWTAAWQSAQQLTLPVLSATTAIICAFAPIPFFMDGIARDFLMALPMTIALALISSLFVSFFITPLTCYVFIKKGLHSAQEQKNKKKKRNLLDYLQHYFNKGIALAFRYPKYTYILAIGSVILALGIATQVEQEFYPLSETKQFNVELWLPTGTSLEETDRVAKEVEALFRKDKRVVEIASFIGMSSPRFNVTYSPEIPRENYAQIFITTHDAKEANQVVEDYLPQFDTYLEQGYVRLRQLSLQEGAPISIRVIGDDIEDQKRVADQIEQILKRHKGTNWVRNSYQEDLFSIGITPIEDKAERYGVLNSSLVQTLGTGTKGAPITRFYEGDKAVDVQLRFVQENRSDLADIAQIYVPSIFGSSVPLSEVAQIEPQWTPGVITHRNGLRTLEVNSETQKGMKAASIMAEVKGEIDQIKRPKGIRIQYGGDRETSQENGPAMMKALGVSLVLIFLILMLEFKTIGKSLFVLATFPLSLLGAFFGLWVTGNPMSMTAFMGIISLIGIVVRNGIIIVDYADELVHNHGYSRRGAALAAAKRRMRPIFLTSAAAAVAVLPMIIGKSPMWAPLGSVLAFGLIVSMVLTLFVVPVLYYRFTKYVPR
ncbi:efflux RND transporter permease subunit [Myroides odoratus]|uniref:efflux RND transporter permease subunit n=1 Tax=Myroides odoratus TaxID=256 RepID=UPI0039AF1A99